MNKACKGCPYTAVCLASNDGWMQVFRALFGRAAEHTGLTTLHFEEMNFDFVEYRDVVEVAVREAEDVWRRRYIPHWCRHCYHSVEIVCNIDAVTNRVSVHLEFHR